MNLDYNGDGQVTDQNGVTREATVAEMTYFLKHQQEENEKVIAARDSKVAQLAKEIERRNQYHFQNEGPNDMAFPASLERTYLGDGIMRIGECVLNMSREFLIGWLDKQVMVEKRLWAENQKLKLEVFNTFRDLIAASPTQNRTLEIFLGTERATDKDFLIALVNLDIPPPNEIGWGDHIAQPVCAVVAANMYGSAWGFAHLSAYEKNAIVHQHEHLKLERNRWYWCSLAYYENLQIEAIEP